MHDEVLSKSQYYRVVKVANGYFYVDFGHEVLPITARKKLKKTGGGILSGDLVAVGSDAVIENVAQRRTLLVRPSIANVDQIVVVLAAVPKPDFLLLDKMLLNCHVSNIEAVICVNKSDIDDGELYSYICNEYATTDCAIIRTSASNGDIVELQQILTGKLTCLAGQSAVGKSSIVNLLAQTTQSIGELSVKVARGKHTTTSTEIFALGNNTYIADTPGFALLSVFDILPQYLASYYHEYVELAPECRFKPCLHIDEPNCAVKSAVGAGALSQERYERYCKIYDECIAQKAIRR